MPVLPLQDLPLLQRRWQSAAAYTSSTKHGVALVKRFSSTGTRSAFGFGITIFLLTLLGVAFYLGRRRERTGTWRLWNSPESDPTFSTTKSLAQLHNTSKSSDFKPTI